MPGYLARFFHSHKYAASNVLYRFVKYIIFLILRTGKEKIAIAGRQVPEKNLSAASSRLFRGWEAKSC